MSKKIFSHDCVPPFVYILHTNFQHRDTHNMYVSNNYSTSLYIMSDAKFLVIGKG